MLREEVLTKWNSCKTKLATVRLAPKEKETWKFMSDSKVNLFHYDFRGDLNQLKKDIEAEKMKDLEVEENDMLIDYNACWFSFVCLILDWIDLKQSNIWNKKLQEKIINYDEILYEFENPKATFYAVARSEWPTIPVGGGFNAPFNEFVSKISLWINLEERRKEIKDMETKWDQEILPKIKGAFYD